MKCFVFVFDTVEMEKILFTCKKHERPRTDESVRLTRNVKIKVRIILKWNLKLNTGLGRDLQNHVNSDCSADKKVAFHFFFTGFTTV